MKHRICGHVHVKNITVSVDDETHRRARIRAAELDTSVSALVRSYLRSLAGDRGDTAAVKSEIMETGRERRRRLLNEVFKEIRATRSGFAASDNLSRTALHERDAVR